MSIEQEITVLSTQIFCVYITYVLFIRVCGLLALSWNFPYSVWFVATPNSKLWTRNLKRKSCRRHGSASLRNAGGGLMSVHLNCFLHAILCLIFSIWNECSENVYWYYCISILYFFFWFFYFFFISFYSETTFCQTFILWLAPKLLAPLENMGENVSLSFFLFF